ncbi:MAG TPA: hypothetical protein VI731_06450 [Bacteroidia bacterium]|nr:hypothetical protein [Bacteroidia bacterium]
MKHRITPAIIGITAIALAAFIVTLPGCAKDIDVDTETTTATDNNICESEFMRIMPVVNSIAIDEQGSFRLGQPGGNPGILSCATVSFDDTVNWPRTMTIDFGTGCTDNVDGKVRTGRIRVTIDRSYDSIGVQMMIVLDSFYVGAIHYEGTMTVARLASDKFGQMIQNGKCSVGGGTPWEILYASTRTITFTSGANSSGQTQIIKIDGTSTGTDRNGKSWTSDITSPIIRDLSCTWIVKGTFVLRPSGLSDRTVDFGNGNCDDKGTITIDGNTFEFTM